MASSMLLGAFDWLEDLFMSVVNLIPKLVYLLYTSLACLLDVFQLFFRKLAGLDVYYVDGEPVTGDLVTNFITGILGINPEGQTYSALATVFWAMIIFGLIICVASTLIAVIKSHYTYDDKSAKGPMQFVYTAVKSVINMVAVPIIVVLGLYVSEALLTALDSITSVSSGTVISIYGDKASNLRAIDSTRKGDGERTYIYYDIFGYGSLSNEQTSEKLALIAATNAPFSGMLFKTAAFNANRARDGQLKPQDSGVSGTKQGQLFSNANDPEVLAEMIDVAFASNLHLAEGTVMEMDYDGAAGEYESGKFCDAFFHAEELRAFSKFNVGLVWYYYDLWTFNFIVGFAGCIVCVTLFINIILGLLTRLFMCIGLFLINPPLFGLAPLDGGKASKGWRENFVKQVLMTYGAVVGMNIMFLILPYMNQISFFNIAIADYLAQTLILIVGLITIKAFISVVSGLVGGEDAAKSGEGIAKDVGAVAGKATKMTVGAAKASLGLMGGAVKGGAAIVNKGGQAVHAARERHYKNQERDIGNVEKKDKLMGSIAMRSYDKLNRKDIMKEARDAGLTRKDARNIWKTTKEYKKAHKDDWNEGRDGRRQADMRATLARHERTLVDRVKKQDSTYGQLSSNAVKPSKATMEARANAAELSRAKASGAATLKNKSGAKFKANFSAAKKGVAGYTWAPFKNMESVMGGSDLYSTFKDKSFWSKPDWAEVTAKNTGDIHNEMKGMRRDMNTNADNMVAQQRSQNRFSRIADPKRVKALTEQMSKEWEAKYGKKPTATDKKAIQEWIKQGKEHIP